jgi:hypothetical protein
VSEPLVSKQTAIEQLRKADERWGAAVRGLKPYAERLRELAEAAEHESRALLLSDLANVKWHPRPGARNIKLAYEVEEHSGRPGPKAVWARFDRAVKELGVVLEGESVRAIADAFSALSAITGELADACEAAAAAVPQQPVARGHRTV